jgi:multicomponent Na+:H+ antiporter subunit D
VNGLEFLIVIVPFAGAVASCFARGAGQVWLGVGTAAATAGTVALLTWQVVEHGASRYPLGGWAPPLGITLQVDGLSVLMLLLTTVVAVCVSVYAAPYFAGAAGERLSAGLFWPLWLLLWGGLNALFVSADVFNLYLLLEFTLLPAVALAAIGGSPAGHVSALRYLLAATVAALFYLVGLTLLYSETSTLDLAGIGDASPGAPLVTIALVCMVGALALKSALFPLHFWLPAAHSTAPAPVSAVLSALVVKAGFYVIVRVWLQTLPDAAPAAAAEAVAVLGATAILWGSWQALRQERLKMLVAYSTVAQIGYLFVLLPLAARARTDVIEAATYHMLSHGLAKAAMFLAAGAVLKSAHSDLLDHTRGTAREAPLAIGAFVIAGAALAGILPGGGAKGKMLALSLEHAAWWWSAVIVAGMVLAAAYTVAAVRFAVRRRDGAAKAASAPPRTLQMAAMGLALSAAAFSFASDAALALLEITP